MPFASIKLWYCKEIRIGSRKGGRAGQALDIQQVVFNKRPLEHSENEHSIEATNSDRGNYYCSTLESRSYTTGKPDVGAFTSTYQYMLPIQPRLPEAR